MVASPFHLLARRGTVLHGTRPRANFTCDVVGAVSAGPAQYSRAVQGCTRYMLVLFDNTTS